MRVAHRHLFQDKESSSQDMNGWKITAEYVNVLGRPYCIACLGTSHWHSKCMIGGLPQTIVHASREYQRWVAGDPARQVAGTNIFWISAFQGIHGSNEKLFRAGMLMDAIPVQKTL